MPQRDNLCCMCDKEAKQKCGNCFLARYCSRQHQKQHWKTHKSQCFPCKVEYSETLGRHLVASRDIKAGETIISEAPLVLGPQNITKPICLGCNSDSVNINCSSCGFLLCSSNCPGKVNHQRECQLIQLGGKKANIKTTDEDNPMYQCITPLRCLWTKEKAKQEWETLMSMEHHLIDRKQSGRYKEVKTFIVNIILNYFCLQMFDEEEIQKTCGILETNGFEVPDQNLVALYSFGYLLEHSCVPNTTRTLSPGLHLVVKAAVDIEAGGHVSTSYINPFWGERMRRVHLMKFKYFECNCVRCLDPTDLNTHLSSIKCRSCWKGLMTPPKNITTDWICTECGGAFDACEIEEFLVKAFERKENLPQTVNAFEKFLKETKKTLSDNHQYRTEAKLMLLQMYGKSQEKPLEKMSEEDVLRKQNLCSDLLEVASRFSPGLSRIRGIILYELHFTYVEAYKKLHKKFKATGEGIKLLQKAEEILTEAIGILKLETHLRDEMIMAAEGLDQMKLIQELKKKFESKQLNN